MGLQYDTVKFNFTELFSAFWHYAIECRIFVAEKRWLPE